jgi:DNA sulfur modification protein DndB
MSNKTLMPAFRCSAGDSRYYIVRMKYAEIAREGQFPYELGGNQELGMLIQRGISNRTKGITEYLLNSKHHFLGGLVVAAWGGEPQYTPLQMEDPEGLLTGLDREFGVLTFDGTQQYFVLDGQHRLRAIKDALKQNPDLGKEDICILIVTHWNTPEGRLRTRRLFTNINRNAKQTGAAENIALDEDDGFAIVARQLLSDHDFLKQDGRVKVILFSGEEGELKLAGGNGNKTEAKAWTTLTVLYDMIKYLGADLPATMANRTVRPSGDVLEDSYKALSGRLDDLLKYCGDLRNRLEGCRSARELRAPKDAEGEGHPFMRPIVQKTVARVAAEIAKQGNVTWGDLMGRFAELDWRLASPPWEAVFSVDSGRMLAGRDHSNLLGDLLHAHLAPVSLQSIRRARKSFRDLRNKQYPVPEEELAQRLPKSGEPEVSEVRLDSVPEVSEDAEAAETTLAAPPSPVPEGA